MPGWFVRNRTACDQESPLEAASILDEALLSLADAQSDREADSHFLLDARQGSLHGVIAFEDLGNDGAQSINRSHIGVDQRHQSIAHGDGLGQILGPETDFDALISQVIRQLEPQLIGILTQRRLVRSRAGLARRAMITPPCGAR